MDSVRRTMPFIHDSVIQDFMSSNDNILAFHKTSKAMYFLCCSTMQARLRKFSQKICAVQLGGVVPTLATLTTRLKCRFSSTIPWRNRMSIFDPLCRESEHVCVRRDFLRLQSHRPRSCIHFRWESRTWPNLLLLHMICNLDFKWSVNWLLDWIRYLNCVDFDVTYVRNYTDIDGKVGLFVNMFVPALILFLIFSVFDLGVSFFWAGYYGKSPVGTPLEVPVLPEDLVA